jgi:hypothetical protein
MNRGKSDLAVELTHGLLNVSDQAKVCVAAVVDAFIPAIVKLTALTAHDQAHYLSKEAVEEMNLPDETHQPAKSKSNYPGAI